MPGNSELNVADEKFGRESWSASQMSRLEPPNSKGCLKTTLLHRQHPLTLGREIYSTLLRREEVHTIICFATVAPIAATLSFTLAKAKEAQLSNDISSITVIVSFIIVTFNSMALNRVLVGFEVF